MVLSHWFDESIQQDIPVNELRDIFNLLPNLQTQRMNRGEYRTLGQLRQFYAKQTEFYQKLDGMDFLTDGQFIHHRRFKNVVLAAVNSGQLDWAKDFLQRNIARVLPEHQEDLDYFSRGTLAFYRGDFKKAKEAFHRLPPLDDSYFFDVHTMRLRMSFEEDDIGQMQMWSEQIREKQKEKSLPPEVRAGYEQFFSFLNEAVQIEEIWEETGLRSLRRTSRTH